MLFFIYGINQLNNYDIYSISYDKIIILIKFSNNSSDIIDNIKINNNFETNHYEEFLISFNNNINLNNNKDIMENSGIDSEKNL